MNCDELLNLPGSDGTLPEVMNKKEKLYSLAASGKTKQYLGVELSWEQIQHLSPEDIEKFYSRFEAHLGSKIVKSLGHTVLSIYTKLVSRFAPIDSEQDFIYDLTQDPVLTKSLESLGCDLYYKYGNLLAPLIAGLITFNHIDLNLVKNERESDESGVATDVTSTADSNQGN